MILHPFPDQKIIKYINEQKQTKLEQKQRTEPSNIQKGYAYINDEKVLFSKTKLFDNQVEITAPADFTFTPRSAAESGLSNHDSTIGIMLENSLEDGKGSCNSEPFRKMEPSIIETNQGREVIYYESINKTDSNDIHEFDFFLSSSGGAIKGKTTCIDYRLNDWKEVILQMIKSITFLD